MELPNPSRETKFSGANGDREIFYFPCSADHEQDWQPYPVDPYSCYMCYHTCRRPDSHTCFFFSFCLFGDVAFSEYFLYHCRFLFVRRVRRTFFPSGWCFFYLVTTGWIFYISLCENSINQAKNTGFVKLLAIIKAIHRLRTQLQAIYLINTLIQLGWGSPGI